MDVSVNGAVLMLYVNKVAFRCLSHAAWHCRTSNKEYLVRDSPRKLAVKELKDLVAEVTLEVSVQRGRAVAQLYRHRQNTAKCSLVSR